MEIGSIFEIDLDSLFQESKEKDIIFPFMYDGKYKLDWFNTGRSAIEALLLHLRLSNGITRVFMPSYNCASVSEAAERAGLTVELYPVNMDMEVEAQTIYSLPIEGNDLLYVVHFFGKIYSPDFIKAVKKLRNRSVTVIEDITLCLLSRNKIAIGFGDYIIGSVRKWFPIPDGGFIASKDSNLSFSKKRSSNDYSFYYLIAQLMKNRYLENGALNKNAFLSFGNMGMDALFSDYTVRDITILSKKLLMNIDIFDVFKRRKENYDYLYDLLLPNRNVQIMVKRTEGMIPMGMVISAEKRDELFRALISKDIYCNIHWRANESTAKFDGSRWLSDHCLTIPCDQRYSTKEMEYIADCLHSYFG